jgi:hypothetical protein
MTHNEAMSNDDIIQAMRDVLATYGVDDDMAEGAGQLVGPLRESFRGTSATPIYYAVGPLMSARFAFRSTPTPQAARRSAAS